MQRSDSSEWCSESANIFLARGMQPVARAHHRSGASRRRFSQWLGGGIMARAASTISIATIAGGYPGLTISDGDWQRIESAYGRALPIDVREQICEATVSLLLFVEGEYGRPVSEARDRVVRIKKVAAEFQETIFGNPQDTRWDARNYADHLIKRNFQDPRIRNSQGPRFLATGMTSLIVACNRALAHLEDPKNHGRSKGETWKLWVRKLTEILKKRKLPTGSRKDADKDKAERPSPFVGLVCELQRNIPAQFRRSTQSPGALAKAIHQARG